MTVKTIIEQMSDYKAHLFVTQNSFSAESEPFRRLTFIEGSELKYVCGDCTQQSTTHVVFNRTEY